MASSVVATLPALNQHGKTSARGEAIPEPKARGGPTGMVKRKPAPIIEKPLDRKPAKKVLPHAQDKKKPPPVITKKPTVEFHVVQPAVVRRKETGMQANPIMKNVGTNTSERLIDRDGLKKALYIAKMTNSQHHPAILKKQMLFGWRQQAVDGREMRKIAKQIGVSVALLADGNLDPMRVARLQRLFSDQSSAKTVKRDFFSSWRHHVHENGKAAQAAKMAQLALEAEKAKDQVSLSFYRPLVPLTALVKLSSL